MILFVDFEASSLLPGSFPIEVAWVDEDGQAESYLIRPHEDWLDEAAGHPGWSADSAAVHGIALETLLAEGAPAEWVARRAAAALGRANVMACSDSPGFDGGWLETLLDAGDIRPSPRLVDVRQVYSWACRPLRDLHPLKPTVTPEHAEQQFRNLALEIVTQAEEAEALRLSTHHRALPDAQSLWRTWRAIRDEVARQVAEAAP